MCATCTAASRLNAGIVGQHAPEHGDIDGAVGPSAESPRRGFPARVFRRRPRSASSIARLPFVGRDEGKLTNAQRRSCSLCPSCPSCRSCLWSWPCRRRPLRSCPPRLFPPRPRHPACRIPRSHRERRFAPSLPARPWPSDDRRSRRPGAACAGRGGSPRAPSRIAVLVRSGALERLARDALALTAADHAAVFGLPKSSADSG